MEGCAIEPIQNLNTKSDILTLTNIFKQATTNSFLEGYAIWPKDTDTVSLLLKVSCNSNFGAKLCNLLEKNWLYQKS
jgi:hypothetical protein